MPIPIQPEFLAPQFERWFEGPARVSCSPGLHILVGPNNAGKTAMLRAVFEAKLGAVLAADEVKRLTGVRVDSSFEVHWTKAMPREQPDRALDFIELWPIDEETKWDIDEKGDQHDQARQMAMALWPLLARRNRATISTNRFFETKVNLQTRDIADGPGPLSTWTATLSQLEHNPEARQRDLFSEIQKVFTDVTEGLILHCRRDGALAVLQIEEPGVMERPLVACGDGLRDLIGIAYCAVLTRGDALFLDEPGLRLHPRAQRRLLGFLEREANQRAVWIATHDPVFMTAPSATSRHFVERDRSVGQTRVRELANSDELRRVNAILGWMPQDAILADRVLFVEGPSDRIMTEFVLRAAGVTGWAIAELGGSGPLWGKKLSSLPHRMQTIRTVAPHARFAVLVDHDGRPESERAALVDAAKRIGLALTFLRRDELEGYWLVPEVVRGLVAAFAADTDSVDGLDGDELVELEAAIANMGSAAEKPSAWLRNTVRSVRNGRFEKVRAAQLGVRLLAEHAPQDFCELTTEVVNALEGCAIQTRDSGQD